jgi:LacI family transcriptional regulator
MRQERLPTMADIAAHAGVALSTVSYVLSGKRAIGERTRERVLAAIDDLGYRPDTRARALASGQTRALALLLPSPHYSLHPEHHTFVAGAAQATSESEYALVLSTAPARASQISRLVDQGRADGIILMEVQMRDQRVERLRSGGYAFSVIGHCEDDQGLSYVDLDFEYAVRTSVEHLAGLGHRRIALFNEVRDRRDFGPEVRARSAFAAVVAELDLDGTEVDIGLERTEIYAAASAVLVEPRPTAAVALGIASAAILPAARDRGLRVPEDLSVVGVLAPQLAELLTPSLTSIDFPAFEMGRLGAEMLINRLAGAEDPPTQLLLRPALTVRESTAQPRPTRRRRSQAAR